MKMCVSPVTVRTPPSLLLRAHKHTHISHSPLSGSGDGVLHLIEVLGSHGVSRPGVSASDGKGSRSRELEEEDGGHSSNVLASQEHQQQQESVCENFILGMLSNFENLTAPKIHNMLKMFIVDPPFSMSLQVWL